MACGMRRSTAACGSESEQGSRRPSLAARCARRALLHASRCCRPGCFGPSPRASTHRSRRADLGCGPRTARMAGVTRACAATAQPVVREGRVNAGRAHARAPHLLCPACNVHVEQTGREPLTTPARAACWPGARSRRVDASRGRARSERRATMRAGPAAGRFAASELPAVRCAPCVGRCGNARRRLAHGRDDPARSRRGAPEAVQRMHNL